MSPSSSPAIIPLEDELCDLVGKAMRGLEVGAEKLVRESGITKGELARLLKNDSSREVIAKVAGVLELKADALWDLSQRTTIPPVNGGHGVANLWQINTEIFGMCVNAYLVKDPVSTKAVLFDTGGDAAPIFEICTTEELELEAVYFTHNHRDHVAAKDDFRQRRLPLFTPERESVSGAEEFPAGRSFSCGELRIETRLTCGHSVGGITYVISGLERPVAVVGDALFARSMGGGVVSYADALRTNRKEIFTLPKEAIICPGHGPMTTVGDELAWNPFF